MAHRSNFYAGPCSVCGTSVPANGGVAEPPPPGGRSWVVKCKKCAGVIEDAKPRVSAIQEGATVVFKPTDFLGGDLFAKYRQATHGARYDGVRRVQVAPVEKAISMTKALHDAGFIVDLSPGLASAFQAKAAEIREGVVQANTRASKVDQELQKRGLVLFPFQRKGVQWLASKSGALLADDMGLGKTIQALIAIPEGQPVLVVGPAVAKNVWEQEAAKWRPDLKVTVLSGRGSFRWPRSKDSGEVFYCSKCQVTFDTKEGFDRLQEGEDILPSIQNPPVLGQSPSDGRVRHGGSRKRQPAQRGKVVHQDRARVPNLDTPATLLLPNEVDGPLPIKDPSDVGEVSGALRDSKRAPLSFPRSKGEPPSLQDKTEVDTSDPKLSTNHLEGDPSSNPFSGTPDLIVGKVCPRCSHDLTPASEVVVVNYDILSADPGVPVTGTVIVADEAHVLKSIKATRTKRFRALSEAVRKDNGKVWLMTATPLMNRPPELWSVLQAAGIAYEAFGSWSNFLRLFNAVEGEWGGFEWGNPDPEVPTLLQKVSLRRTKLEVLPELPAKSYRDLTITLELDAKTKKACAKAASLLETYTRFSRINDEDRPTDVAAAELLAEKQAYQAKYGDYAAYIDDAEKLLQRVSGLDFQEIAKARAALATAKIPALMALVEDFEEQNEPLVVFSAHRAPIDVFVGREGWEVITGDTSPAERVRIQNDFQEGKLKGIAGTIKAAGVALTLTRASNAIFVDLEWTPALNSQAEDRILRIGQTRGVLITTLIADFPLDKRVTELLAIKRTIIKGSVEASSTIDPTILMPEIAGDDLDAITKAAEEERAKEEAAQKEAEERRKEFAGKAQEIAEKAEKERDEERKRQRKQLRLDRWTREAQADAAPRRPAQTAREHWIVEGLQTLAQLDPDRAAVKNDVGFSASDGGVGHKLAYLAPLLGLTDQQWGLAYALCRKYHRQIGNPPKEES